MAAMVDAKIAELSHKEELTAEETRELGLMHVAIELLRWGRTAARASKAQEKEIAKILEGDESIEAKLESLKTKSLSLVDDGCHLAEREPCTAAGNPA